MPQDINKIAFLVNPKIRNFYEALKNLEDDYKDLDYKIFLSDYPGHLFELPAKAIWEGYKTLIAVGGDGTLNEMLNGIIRHFKNSNGYDWDEIKKIKIGVLPEGSGNDFSRNIYVDIKDNLRLFLDKNKIREVDLGLAGFYDIQKNPTERFFINITDLGIGGRVAQVKSRLPNFFSPGMKYFLSIIYGFLVYRKKNVRIESEDFRYEGKLLSFTAAIGKYFGKGIGIAPEAIIDDGRFALTNIGNVNLLDYAIHSRTARKLQKIKHSQVSYHEGNEIFLESTKNEDIEVDIDGEFAGYAPIRISCLKQKITLIG